MRPSRSGRRSIETRKLWQRPFFGDQHWVGRIFILNEVAQLCTIFTNRCSSETVSATLNANSTLVDGYHQLLRQFRLVSDLGRVRP